jgi:hypothetical protein
MPRKPEDPHGDPGMANGHPPEEAVEDAKPLKPGSRFLKIKPQPNGSRKGGHRKPKGKK